MLDLRLKTERLTLRRFRDDDAPRLQELLAEWDVARMTGVIPHPYGEGEAVKFIESQREKSLAGTDYSFCIARDDVCIGGIGLHRRGCALTEGDGKSAIEIGYWIGKPYWGHGYATEAAKALVGFAFEFLSMREIVAGHFADNPSSGKVLAKLGFVTTGTGRHMCVARGSDVDNIATALTRDAWLKNHV